MVKTDMPLQKLPSIAALVSLLILPSCAEEPTATQEDGSTADAESVGGGQQAEAKSWFFEDFEAEGNPVSVKRISGQQASKDFKDNSGWSDSKIEYEVVGEGAYSGQQFQRVTLQEGKNLEILKYGLPAKPGTFFQVEVALKGTPRTLARLVLSNTSTPKSGDRWQSHWSRDVELTDEWVRHRFIMPDAIVPDELRFGIRLSQPGVLDMDALKISIVSPEEAMAQIRDVDYVVPYAQQLVDGKADSQPADPWKGQFYLTQDDQLTAADVVGPDGLVYPDWRYAGIPGGIPEVPVVVKARDHGAIPDDATEDHEAIMKAVEAAAAAGGGAVQLEAGHYLLGKPLLIVQDNVVLRGAGMDATTLSYTYKIAPRSLNLVSHEANEEVGYHDILELHADPNELNAIEMKLGGRKVAEFKKGPHKPGQYWVMLPQFHALNKYKELGTGPTTLEARAEWADGSEATLSIPLKLAPKKRKADGQVRHNRHPNVITFAGDRTTDRTQRWRLAQDLKRGERTAVFEKEPTFKVGDLIILTVPPNEVFNDRVRSARKDIARRCIFIVEGVEGAKVTLNQPARIDYPASQGARAVKAYPIRNSGIEDLTLEQLHKHWTHGIVIDRGYLCWMRGIRVTMAGRNPIGLEGSKQCEVRDSEFNDAWYLGGGGTGYVSFTDAYDCLMEDIHTRRLRHAPNAQWTAQGNVFRNSVFEQSDAQFHMGWAVENLFENCIVDAAKGSGSYGYGLFVQMPEFAIHGPGGGPRNVMYYNSFKSPDSGVFLGGSNEAWMILYNYFKVEGGAAKTFHNTDNQLYVHGGPGMVFRQGVFDLIVKENHLEMHSPTEPAFFIEGEAPGIQILDNQIASRSGILFDGDHPPAIWAGNEIITKPGATLKRPDPAVKSIFEWQRKQK